MAKAVNKKRKATKATTRKMDSMSGHDPKNGLVSMVPEKNGYRVTNDRLGYSEFHATRIAAVGDYNFQITNSARQ